MVCSVGFCHFCPANPPPCAPIRFVDHSFCASPPPSPSLFGAAAHAGGYCCAFVATSTFNFVFAGSSLFINTFGWEVVGLAVAWLLSSRRKTVNRQSLWRWYCLYQLIETLCSCVSVSVLRRHLMVWDIYAPHFLFVAIFTILFSAFQLLVCYYGYRPNSAGG